MERWRLGKDGGENDFRELSWCLFPLSHSGADHSHCHQQMELRSSQCSRGSSAECVHLYICVCCMCVIINIDIFFKGVDQHQYLSVVCIFMLICSVSQVSKAIARVQKFPSVNCLLLLEVRVGQDLKLRGRLLKAAALKAPAVNWHFRCWVRGLSQGVSSAQWDQCWLLTQGKHVSLFCLPLPHILSSSLTLAPVSPLPSPCPS